MVAQSASASLLIVLISFITTLVRGSNVYCVKPNTDLICSSSHICEDLHFYASNVSHYFASDTTLEFLPGDHWLAGLNISVANVANLQLTGESTECVPSISQFTLHAKDKMPQITCAEAQGGFAFRDVQNLTLSSLSISHCGQPVQPAGMDRAALKFSNIQNLLLQSMTVFNTSGYGLLAHNIYGRSAVSNCDFQLNRGSVEYQGGNAHFNYSNCPLKYTQGVIEMTLMDSTFSFGGYNGNYSNSKEGTFATGVSLELSCTNVAVFVHNVTMANNSNDRVRGYGGNMFVHFYNNTGFISNTVHISGSKFFNGNAWLGGGIGISLYIGASYKHHRWTPCENTISITGTTITGNLASSGSGVYLDYLQQLSHNNCTANVSVENTVVSSNAVTKRKNQATITNVGVAMTILNGQLSGVSITNTSTFSVTFQNITMEYNTLVIPDYQRLASGNAALYVENLSHNFVIKNSRFQHNNVTGLSAFHSYVTFSGESTFLNNTGIRGGGLIACESTYIILTPNTTINFIGNHAKLSGGGIYAEEQCANSVPLCFYQVDRKDSSCGTYGNVSQLAKNCNMKINMINNTAEFAGSHIYGGSISNCYFHTISIVFEHKDFRAIFNLEGPSTDLSNVSSDPKMACFCQSEAIVNCTQQAISFPGSGVYPGQTIAIYMIVTGQLTGSVPGLIRANTTTGSEQYKLYDTKLTCTEVSFPARSCDYSNTIYEFEVFFRSSKFSPNFTIGQSKYLHVAFKDCPSSYVLNASECKCDCHESWNKIECNFEQMLLTRHPPAWLGFMVEDIVYQEECPYDYCREEVVKLKLTNGTFDPNAQCSPHRVGLLCGECAEGYSLSASSSACIDCTSHAAAYLAGYIVGRLLLGIALLFLLTACNWTVTDGTLSGLLFYVNIFKMNSFIFLPHRFNALTVLLSWMNLDFQFTECLYNGMDSYMKAWLGFVFPVYLWTLVAAVVLLSRRFNCIARLFAGNTIKILATLIELSYAGLTQAVMIALSPISVTATSSNTLLLWFYDGNIQYLELKHLLLLLVGTVFGILILAHTFVLLFVQPLQRYSNLRCLSWVAKLKPLIDAYTAPHIIKDQCGYWPGLLLLVRLLLIITFALNTRGKININLRAILMSCLFILSMAWSVGGVYKKTYLNILNSLSIVNLGVLSTLLIARDNGVTIAYFSASLAVLTMLCVLGWHVLERLRPLYRMWRRKTVFFMREPLDARNRITENSDLLPQLRE